MIDRLSRHFFRHFFRLLLVGIAIGEWVCVAWLLRAAGVQLPLWSHVAAPLAIHLFNRAVSQAPHTTRSPWSGWLLRGYTSFAFTAMFGFMFLALNTVAWTLLAILGHGVSLAAGEEARHISVLPSAGYEWSSTLGLITIGCLFVYGYTIGQRRVVTTTLRLPLRRARPEHRGLRIVQITDIHIGRYMTPDVLAGYVERVNQLSADVLVITGDLLDAASAIPKGFPTLARLQARHGVFVVLGNHDFYAGADEVTEGLRRLTSFTVLRDDVATVEINGARLHIAGVDDLGRDWARGVTFHPALEQLRDRLPDDEPVVLLSHRPDLFPQAAAAGIDLVLSGHTHGGQLSLPPLAGSRGLSLARFATRFDRGLYREGDSFLYVNRGIGCTAQRIRLFATREIAVIEIAA